MISTTVMIRLGHVKGNKMVDMKLTNHKLIDRGARFVAEELKLPVEAALKLLKKYGSVRAAIDSVLKKN
jgi:N-acetylmuramic acid 6-phosphate etherase